jgi:hypothetical protein
MLPTAAFTTGLPCRVVNVIGFASVVATSGNTSPEETSTLKVTFREPAVTSTFPICCLEISSCLAISVLKSALKEAKVVALFTILRASSFVIEAIVSVAVAFLGAVLGSTQSFELSEPPGEVSVSLGHGVQLLGVVPPVLERYRPAGHAVQLVDKCALALWWRPAGHEVQLLPDKYWPLLHDVGLEDAEHEEAPLDDVLPLGQLEHELELVPRVLERYRPAGHAVQLLPVYQLEDW